MDTVYKNYRDESRRVWGSNVGVDESVNREAIQLGCQLRIADALELLAQNHKQLIEERDRYERYYREQLDRMKRLTRRESALRGVITRMKNGRH